MNQSNDPHGDELVIRRVKEHADAVDRKLPKLSGEQIRSGELVQPSDVVRSETELVQVQPSFRSRLPFLAAAAAILAAVGAVVVVNATADDQATQLQAAPAASTDQTTSTPTPTTTEAPTTEATTAVDTTDPAASEENALQDEGADETVDPASAFMAVPVAAEDFSPDVRYLPNPDSGFVVASGGYVLLGEAVLGGDPLTDARQQRVAMRAEQAGDRRAVLINLSTFETAAEADAVLAAEPTMHGEPGEAVEINGQPGAWSEHEGFAPYSSGNPMHIIRSLRLRYGPTSVLDITAPSVDRVELEAVVSSLVIDADGTLQDVSPPIGFESGTPTEGVHPGQQLSWAGPNFLELSLTGVDGEELEVSISPASVEMDAASVFESTNGQGWIETGLFGEPMLYVIGPDLTIRVTSYDGQMTIEEMIAVADSIEPVDDATWAERLAIAPLYQSPVMSIPPTE